MESLEYLMYVDEEEEKEKIRNSAMKEAYRNGELKVQKEIIKNATKMNLTLEQISNIINLPIDEVLIIQDEIKNNQD